MKKFSSIALLILTTIFAQNVWAQNLIQTIKGTVMDKSIKSPLIGANVVILNTNPLKGATVDAEGNFKIEQVAVGKYSLKITFIGYKDVVMNNISVNSGKELDLTIELEENAIQF